MDTSSNPASQPGGDRHRILRAFNASLAFVFLLLVVFVSQPALDVGALAVSPRDLGQWLGLLAAPLLHGSPEHLGANAGAILILGTLAGAVYPRATLRALPLLWLGSGLGAWLLGEAGSRHLGASGLTHGLMFMIAVLGLRRRDRASIAAGMIGVLFYGGMLMTVLPHEPGISWQSHLGGGLAGVVAGLLWWRADPLPPRPRYSWEDEEEAATLAGRDADELEPVAPREVPVLWQRQQPPGRGVVLRFTPRPRPGLPEE
ncbi:Rhomboid family protein [Pseudoxanthomonas suwonensis 11-1]|uniref:Rhomboid family protein n=1 Tax=Pseudoxanthomonas suwonensis (strain 11-1) TaxID=743721 RepID=E6WP11_PSEUU|nr:rhomboid family intramembrane serine protease [Pseudoxanthomonas suwonensis]ADV25910.1 Rhomboid family protein [Pseudoxanthomonas suwonensis 11-1]